MGFSRRIAISATVGLVAAAAFAAPSQAADTPTLAIRLSVSNDGTAPFDPSAGAGLDASAHDGVVRTGDLVEYQVQWSVNGASANPTIAVTIPANAAWTAIPAACRTGGSPTSSITATTLTCNLGNQPQGQNGHFNATARVGVVPNGTVITASASIQAPGATPAAAAPVNVGASATALLDLLANYPNASTTRGTPHPITAETGTVLYVPLTVEVPGTGLGAEPLDPNQDLLVALDYSAWPASATMIDNSWSVRQPFDQWSVCGPNNTTSASLPFGTIGSHPDATTLNSAADSGNWTCVDEPTARRVDLTISGADLAPNTFPSASSSAFPIDPNRRVLVAGVIAFWISDTDINNIIAASNGGSTNGFAFLPPFTASWATQPHGVSGLPTTGDDPSNDAAAHYVEQYAGGGITADYVGDFAVAMVNEGHGDLSFLQPRTAFPSVPQYSYLVPGQTGAHSGDGSVVTGQRFGISTGMGPTIAHQPARQAVCIQLGPGQRVSPIQQYLNIDVRPIGNLAGFFANLTPEVSIAGPGDRFVGDLVVTERMRMTAQIPWFAWFADLPEDPTNPVIEYSTDSHNNNGQCGTGYTWSATPPADPGQITQIRLVSDDQQIGDNTTVYIPLIASSAPVGTKLFFTASHQMFPNGTPFDEDAYWYTGPNSPNYDPALACNPPTNLPSYADDCLTMVGPRLSITQSVTSSRLSDLIVGEHVTLQIDARAVGAPGTQVTDGVVRTTLPPYLAFDSAGSTPPTNGAASGDHTLEWTIGTLDANVSNLITINAVVLPGAGAFAAIDSTATIDGNYDDGSGGAALPTQSATTGLRTAGVYGAFEIVKSTSTPVVDRDGVASFNVSLVNNGASPFSTADAIDVLPYQGDTNGSSFSGTTSLTGVTAPGAVEVRFTSASPSTIDPDPAAPSNDLISGTTKWCLAADFGNPGCPTSIGQTTAIRAILGAGLAIGEQVDIAIDIDTEGNLANDHYVNDATARVAEINLPVTSVMADARVRGTDLRLTKTPPADAHVGGVGDFTLTATNLGVDPATGVIVTDPLPAGMSFVSASNGGTHADGIVTWDLGTLNPGEAVTLTVTVSFDTGGAGTNTASLVSDSTADRTTADDSSSATVSVGGTSTTTTPDSTTTTIPETNPGDLAFTGSNALGAMVTFGVIAVATGLFLRRRVRRTIGQSQQ